ncbi:MAG: hypothetical protein AAF806_05790 [Bacteroidota bacterium]
MKLLIEKLRSLSYDIDRNIKIHSPINFVFDGLEQQEMDDLQEDKNFMLDDKIQLFFSYCSSVEIEWIAKREEISGAIYIPELSDIFDVSSDAPTGDNLWLKNRKLDRNTYHPFDLGISEDIVCFKVEKGVVKDNLYLISIYESEVIDMNIGIKKYIELFLEVKGYNFWQRAFLGLDKDNEELVKPRVLKLFS